MATRETATLAILFADIAKSTHLYETLGDKMAQNLIGRCLTLFSRVAEAHQGTVIKTIGDEIMCTFPTIKNYYGLINWSNKETYETVEDVIQLFFMGYTYYIYCRLCPSANVEYKCSCVLQTRDGLL